MPRGLALLKICLQMRLLLRVGSELRLVRLTPPLQDLDDLTSIPILGNIQTGLPLVVQQPNYNISQVTVRDTFLK